MKIIGASQLSQHKSYKVKGKCVGKKEEINSFQMILYRHYIYTLNISAWFDTYP